MNEQYQGYPGRSATGLSWPGGRPVTRARIGRSLVGPVPGLLRRMLIAGLILFPLTGWPAGWLEIRSDPGEAAVFVNGRYQGTTPADSGAFLKLAVVNGLHQVRVFWKSIGGQSATLERRVSVAEGKTIQMRFEAVTTPPEMSDKTVPEIALPPSALDPRSLPEPPGVSSVPEPPIPGLPETEDSHRKIVPLLRNF